MANPLILHCFDEDYRVNEEVVSKLFRNSGGVSNISASMDKLYETLSTMDLEEEFIFQNLDKLDIIKLISRKTLTGSALLRRLDAVINFVLNGVRGTTDERYKIIKNHMLFNTSIEETEEAMIEFMNHIKFMIEGVLEEVDPLEMTEVEENNLIKLYYMLNILYLDNKKILIETESDVLDKLTGAGAMIYLIKNENAPTIDESIDLELTENSFVVTLNICPDIVTDVDELNTFVKLQELFLVK